MKVYELKLQKGGRGVYKVSLVKDPAIESTLLKFSKEQSPVLTFANQERREIYSVAMRPNLEIYRSNVNGEPAKVFYSAETVREAQINYFRQNGNKSTNINHEDIDIPGVFSFENWIVRDPKTDIATAMGLEVFAGDWVMAYKIDNDDIWDKYIKEGKLDGLSIEATNLEHIFKNEITMSKNKKSLLAFVKEGLDSLFTEAEKFEGDVVETPVETEEEKKARLAKEADLAAAMEEPVVPTPEPTDPPEPTEKEMELMDEIISLKQTIAELEADKVKEATDLQVMKAELVKMKKQTPAAASIPLTPTISKHTEEKEYSKMSNYEKVVFNREN